MNRRRDPGRYIETPRSKTFEARFWAKVDKRGPDECWLWKAHLTSKGYGELYYGGPDRHPVNIQAHQAAWLLSGRTLPTWPMVLDHTCRNRVCANPAHLRVVHQRINTIENSESEWAKNHQKTHCLRGHELAGDNVRWVDRNGQMHRQCKACTKLRPSYVAKIKGTGRWPSHVKGTK